MIIDSNKRDDEMTCHRDGHKHRLCKDLRDTCYLWIRLPRKNRVTGEDVEEYHCGDVWNVILAAEQCRETVGVHVALNSFRNEMVCQNDDMLQLSDSEKERLLDGPNHNSS